MEQTIAMSIVRLNDEKGDRRFIEDGMNEVERNTKRIFDFVVAAICLIIFSPLFLICYIAVRKEDGGRPNYGARPTLSLSISDTSWCNILCHSL